MPWVKSFFRSSESLAPVLLEDGLYHADGQVPRSTRRLYRVDSFELRP